MTGHAIGKQDWSDVAGERDRAVVRNLRLLGVEFRLRKPRSQHREERRSRDSSPPRDAAPPAVSAKHAPQNNRNKLKHNWKLPAVVRPTSSWAELTKFSEFFRASEGWDGDTK